MALLDAVQGGQLGQHGGDQPEPVGQREPLEHAVGDHEPAQLGEDPLRGGVRHGVRCLEREPLGAGVGREAELGGEPREPQRAERVAGVGGGLDGVAAEHAQPPRLDVGDPALRVDRPRGPVERHGDRVRGEVAPGESSSIVGPWSGDTSQVKLSSRATTRQAPNSSESRNAGPRRAPWRSGARPIGWIAGHSARSRSRSGPPEQRVADGAADDPRAASAPMRLPARRARAARLQPIETHCSCR